MPDWQAPVAAPLERGLGRDPRRAFAAIFGARTFDGWLKPPSSAPSSPTSGDARARHAEPVHGRLGALAFRRAAARWRGRPSADRARRAGRRRDRRPRPAPLLILDEVAAAGRRRPRPRRSRRPASTRATASRRFVVGKANEVAATAAQTLAEAPTGHLQPAVPPRRHRARQDPPAARASASAFLASQPGRAGRLDVGREVHGRVRPRDARERHDRLQAAAAQRRPAADRRRPVHRRQGFDAGRILPHDERDHHRRAAAGDHRRTARRRISTGSRRASCRACRWGLVADINPADFELRSTSSIAKLARCPASDAATTWSISSPAG